MVPLHCRELVCFSPLTINLLRRFCEAIKIIILITPSSTTTNACSMVMHGGTYEYFHTVKERRLNFPSSGFQEDLSYLLQPLNGRLQRGNTTFTAK